MSDFRNKRRRVQWVAAGLSGMAATPLRSLAQMAGQGTIRLVVPFAPGGSTDLVARIIAEKLTQSLHRTVIVENKPGAGGNLGNALVAQATPDGLTFLLNGTSPMAISLAANLKLNYDPVKDLSPVAMVSRLPNLVAVNAALPIRNVAELVAAAKAAPGKMAYGMSAIGNLSHLNAEMFAQMNGLTLTGVAYKGSAPLITDLIGGTVQMSFDNLPPFVPHVRSGKLRALAVTSATRSPTLPDVPTLAELGYAGFDNAAWFAVWGPKNLPAEMVSKMGEAITQAVREPEVIRKLEQAGVEAATGNAQDVAERIQRDREKFARVIKTGNLKIE